MNRAERKLAEQIASVWLVHFVEAFPLTAVSYEWIAERACDHAIPLRHAITKALVKRAQTETKP